MMKVRALTMAVGLALATLSAGTLVVPSVASAAEEQKVSAKVGKPLKEALDAAQKKQWDQAAAKLKEAQAVDKRTPFDDYKINEILGFVLINQKEYGEAATVYEKTLASGMVPAEQVDDRTKTVAQLYFQEKQYGKSVEYIQKWLKNHPNDTDMGALLAQAYYVQNQFKPAIEASNTIIKNAEKAGQPPKENWLQIVLSSAYKLDDQATVNGTLEKLVRYYPKDEYWEALLSGLARKQNSDPLNLAVYRLMLETNTLKRPEDYEEMAQLAIDRGVPGEAQKIVEAGFAKQILGADPKQKARHERLLASAKKLVEADKAALPQLEKDAAKSPTGQADVALGQAYLSYDQYDKAIEALERGIKKGQLKTPLEEAQIALGIAYMRKNQRDQARTAFKAIGGDSPYAKVASLWSVRASAS